jgi:cell division protease FtsH
MNANGSVLAMLMAGRAAEQIVVGRVSSGSGGSDDSDFARATKLAVAMERTLGFAAVHPLLYRHDKDQGCVLDGNPDLSARVYARLETALARAQEILRQNSSDLDALIGELFKMQSISEEDVSRIITK